VKFNNTSCRPNNITERDRLILDHLPVCKAIAVQIHKALPVHIDLDDLIQAGVLGLLDAAEKYNPSKAQFPSYAKHRIRGAILDSLRKLDFASRDLRRRWKQVEAVMRELRAILQRDPTEEEVAERLHIDIARLRKLRSDAHSVGQFSTSHCDPVDDHIVEQQFTGRPETRPDNIFSHVQMSAALDQAMKPLRPRQQQVVMAYYSEQKTMKEIGHLLGINESRVSQLHKSALAKMQVELRAQGVHCGGAF